MGLTKDEIDQALAFDVAYQDAMRCNIRFRDDAAAQSVMKEDAKPNSCLVCNFTFIDKVLADSFAKEFEGCEARSYPLDLVPVAAEEKRKPGPKASGTAKSNRERQREFQARKRAERDRRKEHRDDS
jgi:hypothetical protein